MQQSQEPKATSQALAEGVAPVASAKPLLGVFELLIEQAQSYED
jgi:hypothetical protein